MTWKESDRKLSFVVSNCEFVIFPLVSGSGVVLIVSIPDLCTLTYYGSDLCLSKKIVTHSCAKTGLNPIQEYPLCAGVGQIPEHWKIRKTSGPLLLIGEGVVVTDI